MPQLCDDGSASKSIRNQQKNVAPSLKGRCGDCEVAAADETDGEGTGGAEGRGSNASWLKSDAATFAGMAKTVSGGESMGGLFRTNAEEGSPAVWTASH